MNRSPSDDTAIDPLARQVADFVTEQIGSVAPPEDGALTLSSRLARFRHARRQRRRLAGGAAVLLVVVSGAAILGTRRSARPADLTYRVDDREPPRGHYVLVPESAPSVLAFSDGSKVRMSPQSRGRVAGLSSRGARFALETGQISVDIVPRRETNWQFEAGPFLVTVHGTSFEIRWNPAETVFEMRLASGAVSVTSPIAAPEIKLRAGQTLRVSLREQTSTIGTDAAGGGAPQEVKTDPAPSLRPPPPSPSQPTSHGGWAHRGWDVALGEGRANAVVSDAERTGLRVAIDQSDSDDLWALSNAARYVGKVSVASQALVAQRRRFPSSERALEAAFLLGRLYDRATAGPADAMKWYDRYLAEAPNGPQASDALGRKMTLLERWNRRTEAAVVAREYLRRFPSGTYATAARVLLRASAAGP